MWRMSPHICKIYSVLLYNRFCHNLCCFVAKYVLLRFTHFCVEKILQKIAYLVKITNMGYGLLLPRVWNYDRLSDWRTWVGSRDAWRAWTRWLIYTDTRLRTTFWLFMDKMDKLHRKEACTIYLLQGKFEMYLNTKLAPKR